MTWIPLHKVPFASLKPGMAIRWLDGNKYEGFIDRLDRTVTFAGARRSSVWITCSPSDIGYLWKYETLAEPRLRAFVQVPPLCPKETT